jgi:LuxR family maltose regulon positive regulatory protein
MAMTTLGVEDSRLRVRFFGNFEVLHRSQVVPLCRNAKALTVLKYLLAKKSQSIPKDYLMSWLWPESDLRRAHSSLSSAIHILRKTLDSFSPLPPANYILLDNDCYRFSPAIRVSTDTDEFDTHLNQGYRLEQAGQMMEAARRYEKAVELYRDDYLIEDLHEDWTLLERERLIMAYVGVLHRLARYYAKTNRHQQSIRACYDLLEKDRCHEDSYRLLMECCVHLGLRTQAMRQYNLYKQMLKCEHNMRPSREMQAFYRSLSRGQLRYSESILLDEWPA